MIDSLPRRIHCLGAGGAGMLPLAMFLADAGHELSAEDDAFTEKARSLLENRGVRIEQFPEDDSVAFIYSSAIGQNHPGRVFARKHGCVAMRRGECLAVIAKEKRLIAVAGSHGKTTTCGMLIDILNTAGFRFDYMLGAQFENSQPYRSEGNEWLVAEIDESDGTIDLFSPDISVIVNMDHDHHARYPSEADYIAVFQRLVQRTRDYVFLEAEGKATLAEAAALTSARLVGLGEGSDVEVEAKAVAGGWSSLSVSGFLALNDLLINRSGSMNHVDASFALLAAHAAGAILNDGKAFEFSSVKRRQRCSYLSPTLQVFDDYAHHPKEVEAVLEAFGEKEGWQTVVVFQPHRYSRTLRLKEQFAAVLKDCETLLLLDVYPASEDEIEGGTSEDMLVACRSHRSDVELVPEGELMERLEALAEARSLRVLVLGAGVGDRLALAFRDRAKARDGKRGELYQAIGAVSSFASTISSDEPLAAKTTMRLGGSAELYYEPESLSQLIASLKGAKAAGLDVSVIGRGSNLVIPDSGVRGLVIRLAHPYWSRFEKLGDGLVRVGAGLRIKALCGAACREGLEGFEFLEGIPGNVGGVLRMNAGAMGGWVFDIVESVRYLTLDGELVEAKREELEFGYRFCKELKDAIAIDAVLKPKAMERDQGEIRRTIDTYQCRRKESQPREPSAGCIFKNPEGDSAGRIIDELGLKGTVVGGAEVSGTHGNFIINRGGATSRDVIELVKMIRRVAKERKGVELQPEVLLFGSKWEDALK